LNFSNFKNLIINLLKQGVLVFFTLTILYPLFFVLITSFKTNNEFYQNIWLPGKVFHFENYVIAWVKGNLGLYTLNSAIVVTSSIFLITLFSMFAGYSLAKLLKKGSSIITSIFLSTIMIPNEATIVLLFALMVRLGIINTRWNLIIVYVGWSLALSTYIFKNFFISLPRELAEAAKIDGCNEFQVFIKVMIPNSKPAIATVIIFNFISLWGEFLWALLTISDKNIKTIPLGLFTFQNQYNTQWGPLSASISITIIPLILLFIYFQKYFIEGLTSGAIKG
jgi:raffinose/stachyose/melibiose transport system permease protein